MAARTLIWLAWTAALTVAGLVALLGSLYLCFLWGVAPIFALLASITVSIGVIFLGLLLHDYLRRREDA